MILQSVLLLFWCSFSDISSDKKSYKNTFANILIHDKPFMGSIPLRISFDKTNGFIKIYDGVRYLVLLDYGECDKICDRIKYLVSEKRGIGRIRIDLYNSLPSEKTLAFHNLIILITSVNNTNENNYYYNIFFKKGAYKDKSNTQYF